MIIVYLNNVIFTFDNRQDALDRIDTLEQQGELCVSDCRIFEGKELRLKRRFETDDEDE